MRRILAEANRIAWVISANAQAGSVELISFIYILDSDMSTKVFCADLWLLILLHCKGDETVVVVVKLQGVVFSAGKIYCRDDPTD